MDYGAVAKQVLDEKDAPKRGIGYGRAMKQSALVDAPAALMGLADLGARGASKLLLGQDVLGSSMPEVQGTLKSWYEGGGEKYAQPDEMTSGERLAGNATSGVIQAIPYALGALATGGGLAPAAMQGIAGATGGLGSGIAKELGFGPVGQTVAGMAGGMLPSAVAHAPILGAVSRGVGRKPLGWIGALDKQGEAEAAGVLRQTLGAADEASGVSGVGTALSAINAELDDVNRVGNATLPQVLGDTHPAGPSIYRMQLESLKNPGQLGTLSMEQRLASLRGENLAALRQADTNMLPVATDAAGPTASVGMQNLADQSKAGVSKLYDAARDAAVGVPPVSATPIVEAAQGLTDDAAAFLSQRLPKEAGEILDRFKATGTASLTELDNLSKSLNQTMADLSRSGDKVGYRYASQLKAALGTTYDELSASGQGGSDAVQALQSARSAHGASEDLYALQHPTVRTFLTRSEFGPGTQPNAAPKGLLAAMRQGGLDDAGKPREAVRLVDSLKADPQALEGAKRVAWTEILGGKPLVQTPEGQSGASLQTALKNLNDPANARSMRVLLGDDGYENAVKLLRRAQQLTYGREGTRGALLSTGSSLASAKDSAMGGLVFDFVTGGNLGMMKLLTKQSAAKAFYDATTKIQRVKFLEKALLDPAYAKFLLERVTPRNVSDWNQRFEMLKGGLESAQAGTRAAGAAAAAEERARK